jgi:ribosomal protein S18 acetylase RimI-like enzyme
MHSAQKIQVYIEQSIQAMGAHTAVPLEGFTLYLHQTDADPAENLLLPRPNLPAGAALERAIAVALSPCAERDRQPHFSFLDLAAPQLAAALAAAGLTCRERLPVLVAPPAAAISLPPCPEIALERLSYRSPLAAIRANLDVNALGFDPDAAPASDEDARQFREHLVASQAFTLRERGEAVAAGMYTAIHGGVTELTGIATLAGFRRRGFAKYLTAAMAQAALNSGAELVFLISATAESAYVYAQAGFAPCGERVSYQGGAGA